MIEGVCPTSHVAARSSTPTTLPPFNCPSVNLSEHGQRRGAVLVPRIKGWQLSGEGTTVKPTDTSSSF
jgi:hypothetical protein